MICYHGESALPFDRPERGVGSFFLIVITYRKVVLNLDLVLFAMICAPSRIDCETPAQRHVLEKYFPYSGDIVLRRLELRAVRLNGNQQQRERGGNRAAWGLAKGWLCYA